MIIEVNWLALFIGAVLNIVLGMVWYSPMLFGKSWMTLMGMKEMKPDPKNLGAMFLIALAIGYILAHFVVYTSAYSFGLGMQTGLWAGLGMTALPMASSTFPAGSSWKLWAINAGYWVVALMLMGGIIAAMR